jgi:hypothetical protein
MSLGGISKEKKVVNKDANKEGKGDSRFEQS